MHCYVECLCLINQDHKDLFKIRDKGLENAEGVTFKDDVLTIKYLMAHYRYKAKVTDETIEPYLYKFKLILYC